MATKYARPTGGSWTDPETWEPPGVPGPDDYVVLDGTSGQVLDCGDHPPVRGLDLTGYQGAYWSKGEPSGFVKDFLDKRVG